MDVLYFLIAFAFFVWILRNILFWVNLWQVKEYRLDRLLAHLKETKQGRGLYLSSFLYIKIAAIFLYGVVVFRDDLLLIYQTLVTGLFLLEMARVGKEISFRLLKRPSFTAKALLLFLLSAIFTAVLFIIPLMEPFVWVLFIDRFIPFVIAFFVLLLSVPTEFFRDVQIQKAIKKLTCHKNLLVVGVTGSYGKSSTKEFTAQILAKKFNVLKTSGTNNTPIGIANTINKHLTNETEIFVAEMGAYKQGEIAELCRITHPIVGIITGISPQHLSMFGSVDRIVKTKYELIEFLPENGIGLFNGNNPYVRKMYNKTGKKKILYMVGDNTKQDSIAAHTVSAEKTCTKFTVSLDRESFPVTTTLLGEHVIENILPGIYLAKHLGMTTKEIQNAIATLTPLSRTMTRHVYRGITLLDDTFNASPDAVLAALDYAKQYSGKKFFVLEPLIELGGDASYVHRDLGKAIGSVCDVLILTKDNYTKEIKEGIGKNKCRLHVLDPEKTSQSLQTFASKGDIIVFEGREAEVSFRKLLKAHRV